jgi:hypothetical protein
VARGNTYDEGEVGDAVGALHAAQAVEETLVNDAKSGFMAAHVQ